MTKQAAIKKAEAQERLEYLRGELRAESISYAEILELQSLVKYIDKNDLELLEAAGVPEVFDGPKMVMRVTRDGEWIRE